MTGGAGSDLFVLGTEYETFYQLNWGEDLGIVKDLNLLEDTVQLHGEAEDYSLVVETMEETGITGTYVYYDAYFEGEAVAFVEQHTELDLAADYFDFV